MGTNFIIAGIPRTGTTLLVHTLNQHPELDVYGEVLTYKGGKPKPKHWQPIIEEQRKRKENNSFRSWLINKLDLPSNTHNIAPYSTEDLIKEYLDNLYNKNSNVGFKLLYQHIQKTPYVLKYIQNKNIKIILVHRKNPLKTATSMMTKKYKPFVPLHFTPELFKKVRQVEKNWEVLDTTFKRYTNKILLTYEDLIDSNHLKTKELNSFLGVTGIEDIPIKVKRTSPDKLKDRFENYKELVQYITNNKPEYERYLYE